MTCKAGKKAGRKGKKAASPTSNDDVPNDNDVDTARSAATTATTTATNSSSPEDDLKIPYGDASGAALVLRDVMLSVADTDLLNDGCATVMKGQVVGLVGGNGCGKSTLLKCIAGARAVDDGAICISTDLEAREEGGGLYILVHSLFFRSIFSLQRSSCSPVYFPSLFMPPQDLKQPRCFRRHLCPREEIHRLSSPVEYGEHREICCRRAS